MYESTDYILKCLKTYQSEGTQPRAKKRRLDHLSWEEKLQRKKLKNRVAAQTSRDRKKAKFEQMEEALKELFKRNESLLQECKQLRTQNQRLTDDNIELRGKLEQSWCANCTRNRTVERDSQSGSAASEILPPQGLETRSAAVPSSKRAQQQAFWKLVLACLLYRTSSTNWTQMGQTSILSRLNGLQRASCKISPETWKLLLRKQIMKNERLMDQRVHLKWWGRHQNNWNPVEAKC